MKRIVSLRKRRQKFEMLRPKKKIKKMYWEFHKGDADINPSVPHGHSLDGKYKLELWSGAIYEVSTGKLWGTVKAKEMSALYRLPGFREFVRECRDEYVKQHPGMILLPLSANSGFIATMRIETHYGLKKTKKISCSTGVRIRLKIAHDKKFAYNY